MDAEYDPKLFNLQLLVQRLQEELSIYRNGTTAEQLYELLLEKDAEIKHFKKLVDELTTSKDDVDEKLKRVVRGSAEILARCEAIQAENNLNKQQITVMQEELIELNSTKQYNIITIESLEMELATRDETISKLHVRCSSLVSEKNEKNKLYEKAKNDKTKVITQLRTEIDRGIKSNCSLKESLSKECETTALLASRVKESVAEATSLKTAYAAACSNIDSLNNQIKKLSKEKEKHRREIEDMTKTIKQQLEQHQQEKEDVKELLNKEMRQSIEKEKEKTNIYKRELDLTRDKVVELEYKMKAATTGDKSKSIVARPALGDRTNMLALNQL